MSRNETEKRGRECGVHKNTKYINHQRTATSHHTLQLSTKMVVAAQPPAGTTAQSPVRSGYTKDQTVGSDAIAMSWLPRYPALDSKSKENGRRGGYHHRTCPLDRLSARGGHLSPNHIIAPVHLPSRTCRSRARQSTGKCQEGRRHP